jgi:MFS family permease
LTSSGEFFSDLEATGRRDANLLQHLDLVAGLVLLVALLLRGPWGPTGQRREWRWLLAFSVAGAVGGQFAYACSEGLSAACQRAQWRFDLPFHHYVHIVSGMAEFALMTVAVYLAQKRTREQTTWTARVIKWTYVALLAGYPLLGVAYLSDEWGAYVEPIFFVCFSIMVLVELFESSQSRSQLCG